MDSRWRIALLAALAYGGPLACSSNDDEPETEGKGGASTGGRGSGGEPTEGHAPVCDPNAPAPPPIDFSLSPDADAATELPRFGKTATEVHGTVTSVELQNGDALSLEIATNDAGPDTRTFRLTSGSAGAWYDALVAALHEPVTLVVKRAKGFQVTTSRGFVLSDSNGPLMAYQGGPFVAALVPEDYPGITVSRGADVCSSAPDFCGQVMFTELVFKGSTEVSVAPGEDEIFLLNALHYRAHTVGASRRLTTTCSDNESTDSWVFWRLRIPEPVDAAAD